ncbi:MAG: zinc dependent phospholipase C family protein [Planctomycetes bacterium]|nr:zinc dependent phospholipase C family protein [Planctomycetota bacterium]
MIVALLAACAVTCLIWECGAPAWGPGMHIQLTRKLLTALRRRKLLRPDHEIVLRYPDSFLYGNIAADVINFKAFGGIKNNCHNWNIQERLEEAAGSDHARAFVLGYLCHLAADLVAHNYFVPYHMVYNFPPRMLGHAYWEAIADAEVSDTEWHTIDRLKESRVIHGYDRLVHGAVKLRVLGLRSNRWIFNNILLVSCRQNWRDFIRSLRDQALKHPIDAEYTSRCRQHSYLNMLAVFYARRFAVLKARDPTGRQAIRGARVLRRELMRDFGERRNARDTASVLAAQAYALPSLLREHG